MVAGRTVIIDQSRQQASGRVVDSQLYMVGSMGCVASLGLGLALAQKIVLDHGGDIAVQSAAGAGTRVTVTLPLSSAHKAA